MPDLSLILLSAGGSSRFGSVTKKQWLRIDSIPLWYFVAKRFQNYTKFDNIVVTASESEINYMKKFADFSFVQGGETRQESLKNALSHVKSKYVMVTDIARACVPKKMLDEIINNKDRADIIVPYLCVSDTVVYNETTIDRDKVKLIQTPQLSLVKKLQKALKQNETFTDDSSAVKANGGTVHYVKGSQKAHKLTYQGDLDTLECLKAPSSDILTGTGFDVHAFEDNKPMHLGGVKIDSEYGFKAHSDGDVAIHALIDALLGAAGGSDIGELYPDNDLKYKNMDSKIMLKEVSTFIKSVGFDIVNIDLTIMAQKPKISPYKDAMRKSIASILEIEPMFVNIKATTTEKLGFIGREEGVGVQAAASLKFYNWKVS